MEPGWRLALGGRTAKLVAQCFRRCLHLAGGEADAEPIDAAHLPAVLRGLAEARQREFAGDSEIEAAFRRFDR